MSGVFHRVVADPAMTIAPNAAQPGASADQDMDTAAAAQFGAALTALLTHAAEPAEAAPDHEGSTGEETATPAAITVAVPAQPDAVAPSDTKSLTRGLDLVAPEFRARLERVIERMESEFGYKVEVVETYRSQARQNALFAQGRTEPGPVVTWTRASNHTAGRAADLVIDGSYDNSVPYERLMRIAREEGLRTLGARDPGHVELPSSSLFASAPGSASEAPVSKQSAERCASVIARPAPFVASQSSIVRGVSELERPAQPPDPAQPTGQVAAVAPVARVATVSPVAQVATVAQVAQVATVGAQAAPVVHSATRARNADPGPPRSAGGREGDASTSEKAGPEQASPIAAPALRAASTSADTDGHAKDGSFAEPNDERPARSRIDPAAARHGATEILAKARDELLRAVAGTESTSTTSTSPGTSESAGLGVGHADMSERIARVLKVQDAAGDRPLSQVLLRLERPDGGEDRVRVDLRGNTVSATLDVGDQAAADRLNANVKELQRTLERHGFETDSLTVRTASRSMEPSTMARGVGASVEADLQRTGAAGSNTNTNTSSRERGARHDEQRPSPDSQRHRSRREQKGGRS
jgi:hypothetical protein